MGLYVHLAAPEIIAAYAADDDPEHNRATALAEYGQNHKVASYRDTPGTDTTDAVRTFSTACGLEQDEAPSRMDEADDDHVPTANLCPKCFKKGR